MVGESFLDKWHLDKSSKKYTCPQCGKKRFVVYVDAETKEPVNEYLYGRCDREGECSYHKLPEVEKQKKGTVSAVLHQVFPDLDKFEHLEQGQTALHKVLQERLNIDPAVLYELGIVRDGAQTVYIFRNQQGKVVNFKWFRYKADGHRDKDFNSYSLKQPEQTNQYVKDYFGMCLFLEHLLDPERKRPVCVVESEKSAAIVRASGHYPEYDWVSCAAASGLSDGKEGTADKITPLKGRTVYWLCDADAAGRGKTKDGKWEWPSSVRNLIKVAKELTGLHVVDLFPGRTDGWDIADAILAGERPKIVPTWTHGKNKDNELHDKREDTRVKMDIDAMLKDFREGKPIGEPARVQILQDNFSWKRGFVNCWTGWPNDGKTTFFQFMALMKAIVPNDNWKWCIWPAEMLNPYKDHQGITRTSASDIMDELVYMLTGRNPYKHLTIQRNIPQMLEQEYLEAVHQLNKNFIFINPKDRKYTDLIDNFKYYKDKDGFDGCLIDPFKNLNHEDDNGARFDLYLDRVFTDMKDFSMDANVSFNIIAHPKNQADPKNQDGSYKICTQHMLAGGAAWNNNMDGIYSVYRPFKHDKLDDPRVTFLNLKQRKQQLVGRVGMCDDIEFRFDTNRYYFDGYCPIDGTYWEPIKKKIERAKEEAKDKKVKDSMTELNLQAKKAAKGKKQPPTEPRIPFTDSRLDLPDDENTPIF